MHIHCNKILMIPKEYMWGVIFMHGKSSINNHNTLAKRLDGSGEMPLHGVEVLLELNRVIGNGTTS